MSKKLIAKGEWAKHLRSYGKRAANKKLRKIFKASLKEDEKSFRFFLTNPVEYGTIEIMERDFWMPLMGIGHMTLLVSPIKGY